MTTIETGKETFTEVQTPSGIAIQYHWEPERKYLLSRPDDKILDMPGPGTIWKEVPSVTTVLDILNKPALVWWGQTIGVEGMLSLQHYPDITWDSLKFTNADAIVDLLTKHKLTVNHVKNSAAKRGQAVHAALEGWAKEGVIPDPSIFPHEEKGYVEGLVKFINDIGDATSNLECEVMVGSIEHGFAGRYDLRFDMVSSAEVTCKHTPVRGAKEATLSPGRYMLDLKTSKRVYNSHFRQLEGYELASIECGYEPTDARGVLHVMDDGRYEFVRSLAQPEDFLVCLELWKSEERMKANKKEKR